MNLQLRALDRRRLTRALKTDPKTQHTKILAVMTHGLNGASVPAGWDGYVSRPIDARALPKLVQEHLATTA